MVKLSSLLENFETFWPAAHADEWDRVGLTVGNVNSDITRVLVSVDLTESVVNEAISVGAELIVTHHPFLLKGIDSVAEDQLKGQLVAKIIRADLAVFAAHTNADVQPDGASTLMAESFGLVDLEPLVPSMGGFGHGVIGTLRSELSLEEFARKVSENLPKTARKVSFAGLPDKKVSRVAICSGAGDAFLPQVLASNADVYVTSDLRHHPVQDAISTPRANGALALIDVAHWAAESLWVSAAIERINSLTGVKAIASQTNTDPWTQEVN